jgi:hypothetical protein
MIAQHLNGVEPGEHIRGVVYLGEGPLVNAGAAPVPKEHSGKPVHPVGLEAFSWMSPLITKGFELVTDMGNRFVLCSLVAANPKLAVLESRLNGSGALAWRLLVDGVKRQIDEPGRDSKALAHTHKRKVHYNGNHSKGGEGIVRVYFASAGQYLGREVVALLAACGNKGEEAAVIKAMSTSGGTRSMH